MDNHTRWTHLQLLATKYAIFQAYKSFEALNMYLQSQGTTRKLTIHDTPEYNGISECLNHTLLERMQALLHASKLPKKLWGEAITHMVWLKNRTPTCTLPDKKTPYEMLNKKKPSLAGLHEWGESVWVHNMQGNKLEK